MTSNKREEDVKKEAQKNAFDNGQSPESVKKNPDPRANENLPGKEDKRDKEGSEDEDTTGAGSEITDGEDG
jgi:hypothetical protein